MKKAIVRILLTCLCFVMLVTAVPFNTEAAYVSVPESIKNTVFDAWYYHAQHGDLAKAFGLVPKSLFNHYVNYGITEGRKASPIFDVKDYISLNGDLKQAFGNNYAKGIKHFAEFGLNSDRNRITTDDISDIGTGYEGRIMLNGSNLCLAVVGSNVQLANKSLNDSYQIWKFERITSGTYKGQYKITNKATGKVLDLTNGKKANGTNIGVYASNDTEAQRWSFFKKTSDVYVIGLYKGSGRCLDVANGKKEAGANIQFYAYNGSGAQFFKIEKSSEFESKTPVNIGSVVYANLTGVGSSLNVGYSGTEVQLKTVNNNNIEQLWKFGRRSDGSYSIMNMRSGKLLEVKGGSSTSSSVVQMANPGGDANAQSWYIYSIDGAYVLVPKCATGCVLDVKGGAKTAGAALQIYTYNASEAQQFKINPNPGNYADYKSNDLKNEFYATITGVNSGKNLSLSGTSVVTANPSNASEQIWKFTKNSNGTYTILNMATGKVLDVKGGATANSTPVQVYTSNNTTAQMWYIYKVDGNYIFVPRNSQGSALNVNGNMVSAGTAVNIYQYNRTTAQYFKINVKEGNFLDFAKPADIGTNFYANLQIGSFHLGVDGSNVELFNKGSGSYWKFERQSNGQYKIIDAGTGKVLDVVGGKMADGTNIQVYDSNNTTAQRWWIYNIGDSMIIASAKDSKFVVDLSGAKLTNGRNIQLYSYNATDAQYYTIANKTDKVIGYYVASPYNSGKIGSYSDLNAAKNLANSKSFLGYVVYDTFGKVIYCPTGSLNTAKIMWNAQLVSDFARDNGFTYGHSIINPAFNWKNLSISGAVNPNQRTTSCDRFCDWVLYRSGFTQGQKYNYGHCVFEMAGWLSSIGFTRITNRSQLRAGDVVFTTYDPTRPGTPAHVYLNASANYGGDVYLRYDHGSNARIRCQKGNEVIPGNQPFKEHVGDFYYAYRPY